MATLDRIRGRDGNGGRTHPRRALLLAIATLAVGLPVSLAGGLLWRANVSEEQRRSFDTAAGDVTATLRTLLRRDADFVAALRSVATMEPSVGPTRFRQWFVSMQGRTRQTGGLGAGVLLSLPSSEVVAFQRARNADPAFRTFVGGRTRVDAPEGRARMCLPAAGASASGALTPTLAYAFQEDWCDPASPFGRTQAPALRAQAETGQLRVLPIQLPGIHTTLFQVAFYRPGAPLATAAERRAALAGWVGNSTDLAGIVRAARGTHRSLGIALYHRNPDSAPELVDRLGPRPRAGSLRHSNRFQIEGPWSLTLTQSPSAVLGLPPDLQGALAFLLGAALSVLLASAVLLLARSRERALGLVRERTGELRHQALHDALTNLPNRVLAFDRLDQMLARARRSGAPVAVLYVDLDGFKHVNDSLGHAAGDQLLRAVARRLESVVRAGDLAARLSGDEFVVLLDDSARSIGAEAIAARVVAVLRQPYSLDARFGGRRLSVTASVGVALASDGTAEELLRRADLALYEAKDNGRDRWVSFDGRMSNASRERVELELDLADAIERDQLFLLYQPTVDLHSEQIVGVEALLRWRHPTRGVIEPQQFIPIAEQNGAIVKIGRWALGQACRQAAEWARAGHAIGVAVNVSTRQLEDDELLGDVRRTLAESGLSPELLTLELTETGLMRDAAASVARLSALKRLGLKIAVDDFGTGYSSLAYLRRFPVDLLKIDRSFVAGVVMSRESAALVDTLVRLAELLGIETLAEGIEDVEQLRALRRARCDYGQGFLFALPLDAARIDALLARGAAGLDGDVADGAGDLTRSFPVGEHVEDPMARH